MKDFKIALLLSGALRCDYKSDLQRIIEELALPLQADVFIASWDKVALWPGAGGLGRGFLRNFIDERLLQDAPEELLVDNWTFSTAFPESFALIEGEINVKLSKKDLAFLRRLPGVKALSFENQERFLSRYPQILPVHNALKMFYNFNRALNLMLSYEDSSRRRYDAILLLRPDKKFHSRLSKADLMKMNERSLGLEFYENGSELGAGDLYFFGKRWAMVDFLSSFSKARAGGGEFFDYFPCGINCSWAGVLDHAMLGRYVKFCHLSPLAGQDFIKCEDGSKARSFPQIKKALKKDLKISALSKERQEKIQGFFDTIYAHLRPLKPATKYPLYNKFLASGRVKSTLKYRLGEALLSCEGILEWLFLPYKLSFIIIHHKKERAAHIELTSLNPKLALAPLQSYADYKAELEQDLPCRAGEAFLTAVRGGGGWKLFAFFAKELPRMRCAFKRSGDGAF